MRPCCGAASDTVIQRGCILRLADDLPLVVEIVDTQEKIDVFLPVLDQMMTSGLVTIEKVQVLQYGAEMSSPKVNA